MKTLLVSIGIALSIVCFAMATRTDLTGNPMGRRADRDSRTKARLIFYDPTGNDKKLFQALSKAGYRISQLADENGNIDSKALLLATMLDDQVERHLQNGGRTILLIDSAEALPPSSPFRVTLRPSRGSSTSGLMWIRKNFDQLSLRKLSRIEATELSPQFTIAGVRAEYVSDILAGVTSRDSQNNQVLALQMQAGGGKVCASTLRFDEYGKRASVTSLFDAMVRYVIGDGFAPKLNWHIREE